MKGILLIKDQSRERNFVEIDLNTLEKNNQSIEDLFEMIIAESRKDGEGLSWAELKKHMKEGAKR